MEQSSNIVQATNANIKKVRLDKSSFSLSSSINDWAIDMGCRKEDMKVDIKESKDSNSNSKGGYAAFARVDVKKGDVIYSVPIGICLDVSKAKVKVGAALDESKLRTRELGMLALLLLLEKQSGTNSKYYSYIQSLPETVDGFLSWSETEIETFSKSTTRKVLTQLDAIDNDYDTISRVGVISVDFFTKEAFRWSMGIVKSRYMYIDGQAMLAPGLDFIQNDPFATNEAKQGMAGMFGGRIAKLTADRAYSAGDRVFMSFGVKNSAESLEDHGIIPAISKEDSSCELSVTIEEEVDKFPGDKILILEDNGWRKTMQFDLEADRNFEIDPEFLKFLRLKFIKGQDAFILEACFANTVFYTLDEPFSKGNEMAVMTYIKEQCEEALLKFNTQAGKAEDEATTAAVVDEANMSVQEMLATLRVQERAALECVLEKAQEELQVIEEGLPDGREYYQDRRLRELDLLRPLDEYELNNF